MTRPKNAFETVRPRSTKVLPPDKQARDHPRKRGADLYDIGPRPRQITQPQPRR